jgi:serine protease Do
MRPSSVLAAAITATFLVSALPAESGAQDRARERERQREIERQRDRSLDLERRDRERADVARQRAGEVRARALELSRQYGGARGGSAIIAQPGGVYTFGINQNQAVVGISLTSEGMSDTLGVHVAAVTRGGPADRAGIREGDRIVSVNGVSVRVSADDARDPETADIGVRRLEREMRRLRAGDEVELRVNSGRETRTVRIRTVEASSLRAEMPEARARVQMEERLREMRPDADARARVESRLREARPGAEGRAQAESRLRELLPSREDADRRAALGVSIGSTGSRRDTLGLMIMRVTENSPAERAGLYEGDRIASINGVDVRTEWRELDDATRVRERSSDFTRELSRVAPGDEVTLRVFSSTGQPRTVRVRAGRGSEVNRGGQGMGFLFREGDDFVVPSMPRALTIPNGARVMPMTPMPRMAPIAPVAPRAQTAPRVRMIQVPPAARAPQPPRPPATSYRIERAAPNAIIRRLENVDTIVRMRVQQGGAPQVIRLNRTIVRI